jgi:hypothetical protein
MATTNVNVSPRSLGLASLVLGILGLVFYWWVPLGMVLAIAGLLFGFIGATLHPYRPLNIGLVVIGILVAIAAIAVDVEVAIHGLDTVRFTSLR